MSEQVVGWRERLARQGGHQANVRVVDPSVEHRTLYEGAGSQTLWSWAALGTRPVFVLIVRDPEEAHRQAAEGIGKAKGEDPSWYLNEGDEADHFARRALEAIGIPLPPERTDR